GDWRAALRPGGVGFLFIGATATLPEHVPDTRLRHAVVAEWLHSFAPELALASSLRGALDDWGVAAGTASAELRRAAGPWQARLGGRLYLQRGADFYQARYTGAPTGDYSSDKELGGERGGGGSLALGLALAPRVALDLRAEVLRYGYDSVLLPSRT